MVLHYIYHERIACWLFDMYQAEGRAYATGVVSTLFNELPISERVTTNVAELVRSGVAVTGRDDGALLPLSNEDPEAQTVGMIDFFVVAAPAATAPGAGIVLALTDQQALASISDTFEAVHHRRPTFWIITVAVEALAVSSDTPGGAAPAASASAPGGGSRGGARGEGLGGGAWDLSSDRLEQVIQSLPKIAASCRRAVVLVRSELFKQPLPLLMLYVAMGVHWKTEDVEPRVTGSYLSLWSTQLTEETVNLDPRPALDAGTAQPAQEPHSTAAAVLATLVTNRGGNEQFSDDIRCFLEVIEHWQKLSSDSGVNFRRYLEMLVAEGMLDRGTLQIEGSLVRQLRHRFLRFPTHFSRHSTPHTPCVALYFAPLLDGC